MRKYARVSYSFHGIHFDLTIYTMFVFASDFFSLCVGGLFMLLYKHFLDFRCAFYTLVLVIRLAKNVLFGCCCWCSSPLSASVLFLLDNFQKLSYSSILQHIRFLIACLLFGSSST